MTPDPFSECQRCGHNWMLHGSDGCLHHEAGYICECRTTCEPPPSNPRGWIKCDPSVPKLLAEAHARADRLDAENNERFSRETEYQNRIRTLERRVLELEQVIRDIRYYAERKL
jgi:hypothetical protein